jgi:hypothetical protein
MLLTARIPSFISENELFYCLVPVIVGSQLGYTAIPGDERDSHFSSVEFGEGMVQHFRWRDLQPVSASNCRKMLQTSR